ncbi:MAG: heme ABC transporter ATP-binding protein [Planctomycetes bacterium]|nr:heme ABC transporter ATP-binding protein [Planctomycetota bacterium]
MSQGLVAAGVEVLAGPRRLLDGVDATVAPGLVLGVLGANGAGKSTLLRCLSGGQRLHGGRVELDGRALTAWSAHDLARRRAVMSQEITLAFPFRAAEVVAMGRDVWRESDRATARVADEMLDLVGMADCAQRIYPTLSGGERQRVQLARALAQIHGGRDPVLLLDEPVSALDPEHAIRVLALIRARARAGAAVLVVLHDLNLAAAFCDQAVFLRAGRRYAAGSVVDLYQPEIIAGVFGIQASVVTHPSGGHPMVIPVYHGCDTVERRPTHALTSQACCA